MLSARMRSIISCSLNISGTTVKKRRGGPEPTAVQFQNERLNRTRRKKTKTAGSDHTDIYSGILNVGQA